MKSHRKQRDGADHRAGGSSRTQFLSRLAAIHGISMDEALAMASIAFRSSIRVNPLSPLGVTAILARLDELEIARTAIPWCEGAFFLEGDKAPVVASDLFENGHVFVHNASSLVPPLVLAPEPDQDVLDVCAAPGGKTIHMAALTDNQARLWANDAIKARADKLRAVVATFHARVEPITEIPGQYVDKFIDRRFDRILLDAQCSGEGMLDLSHPNALRYWSPQRITKFSYLQKRMLISAFKLLRPGGVLVYSTCTHAPEENEWPVTQLLDNFPDAQAMPITLDLPNRRPGLESWQGRKFHPGARLAARILPTVHMEAFFVCRIGKTPDANAPP